MQRGRLLEWGSGAPFGNRNSNERLIGCGLFLDRVATLIPIQ
jgi:hypothetical protein